MYFVGIDVSKYKHDCFIQNELGEVIINHLVIANSHEDVFQHFLLPLNLWILPVK